MKKEALSFFTNPDWILLSFLLFVGVFVFVLLRTLFFTKKQEHLKNALLPFYEELQKKKETP